MQNMQDAMQRETTALTRRFTPANIALSIFNALSSAALLLGGALLFSFKPIGRTLALYGAGALAVVDTAQLAVSGWMQYEMSHVLARAMGNLPQGASAAQTEQMMKMIVGGSTILAIGLGAIWLLIKLGFYGTTFVYLRRSEIRELFR